jgi:MerR family redox-sensitive transcriptional activator SoxR
MELNAMEDSLSIGEMASILGVQASTLRYYESIGILPPPRRVSGQRRYSRDMLPLLAVIQLAKEANFSLPEIRALLYGQGGTPSERWKRLALEKLEEVNAVISRAQEMKQLLEEALHSDALHFELDMCVLMMNVDAQPKEHAS